MVQPHFYITPQGVKGVVGDTLGHRLGQLRIVTLLQGHLTHQLQPATVNEGVGGVVGQLEGHHRGIFVITHPL